MIQAAAELCLYDGQVAMRTRERERERERERNSALDCARQRVRVCKWECVHAIESECVQVRVCV